MEMSIMFGYSIMTLNTWFIIDAMEPGLIYIYSYSSIGTNTVYNY